MERSESGAGLDLFGNDAKVERLAEHVMASTSELSSVDNPRSDTNDQSIFKTSTGSRLR